MALKINQAKLTDLKKSLKKLARTARPKIYDVDAALNELKEELFELKEKGFDSKEIAGFLKEQGLSASATKISKFMATLSVTSKKEKTEVKK